MGRYHICLSQALLCWGGALSRSIAFLHKFDACPAPLMCVCVCGWVGEGRGGLSAVVGMVATGKFGRLRLREYWLAMGPGPEY